MPYKARTRRNRRAVDLEIMAYYELGYGPAGRNGDPEDDEPREFDSREQRLQVWQEVRDDFLREWAKQKPYMRDQGIAPHVVDQEPDTPWAELHLTGGSDAAS
jgi:hypothetical protein